MIALVILLSIQAYAGPNTNHIIKPTENEIACEVASDCVPVNEECSCPKGVYINEKFAESFGRRVTTACAEFRGLLCGRMAQTDSFEYPTCESKKCKKKFARRGQDCGQLSELYRPKCESTFTPVSIKKPRNPKDPAKDGLLSVFGKDKDSCKYPAAPINWIARYCALEVGTDDEIAIQDSPCFKAFKADLDSKEKCQINEKFKVKICEKYLMKSKKFESTRECLNDPTVKPFFAGNPT